MANVTNVNAGAFDDTMNDELAKATGIVYMFAESKFTCTDKLSYLYLKMSYCIV